jgi:hypothetical protein
MDKACTNKGGDRPRRSQAVDRIALPIRITNNNEVDIADIGWKLLGKCANRDEAEPDFKSNLASGLRPKWCPPPETSPDDGWMPPRLEARFTFIKKGGKLYGMTYSVIAGTDIFVDISKAAQFHPGYVTPALLTDPYHQQNPFGGFVLGRFSKIPEQVLDIRPCAPSKVKRIPFSGDAEDVPSMSLIIGAAVQAIAEGYGNWEKIAAQLLWDNITIMNFDRLPDVLTYQGLVCEFPDVDKVDERFGKFGETGNVEK